MKPFKISTGLILSIVLLLFLWSCSGDNSLMEPAGVDVSMMQSIDQPPPGVRFVKWNPDLDFSVLKKGECFTVEAGMSRVYTVIDGSIRIKFFAGSLDPNVIESVEVCINPVENAGFAAYDFNPSMEFNKDFQLTFSLDYLDLRSAFEESGYDNFGRWLDETLNIWWWNYAENKWEEINLKNVSADHITGLEDHFSRYAFSF